MGSKREPKEEPAVLSLDEANELYADKWVLMRVTKFDRRHDPVAGQIVASGSEQAVWRRWDSLRGQPVGPERRSYFIFKAFRQRSADEPLEDPLEIVVRRGWPRGRRS